MIEYLTALIWLALWPLIVYLGYQFAAFNMEHFTRIEQLHQEAKDRTHADV